MENTNNSPEELNPTNGNENNDNLQNNSEENTQNENTEKKTPIHVPGMIERMIEEDSKKESEETQKEPDPVIIPKRDSSVWDHIDDTAENNAEENNNQETNGTEKRRYNKRNNKRIANLKRAKEQKEKKKDRLGSERDAKKADISRGYLIVHLNDDESDTEHTKHVPLDVADKEIIKAVIAEREEEIFDLKEEIEKIDNDIKVLASVRKSSARNRLGKKIQTKQEKKLVEQIDKALTKASGNGKQELVSEIESQIKKGDNSKAYNSLKAFLSEQVKPVAKKLDKSEEFEKSVLNKVIENITKAQS